jgi:hypothetical protein
MPSQYPDTFPLFSYILFTCHSRIGKAVDTASQIARVAQIYVPMSNNIMNMDIIRAMKKDDSSSESRQRLKVKQCSDILTHSYTTTSEDQVVSAVVFPSLGFPKIPSK